MLARILSAIFVFPAFWPGSDGFCNVNVRWNHRFNIEDVYGIWYGVAYVQHTPDFTNKPIEVGCLTMYVADGMYEIGDNFREWSIFRPNYSDFRRYSNRNNPWAGNVMTSWPDYRVKRSAKREVYGERKLKVIWDEDGNTMEQAYIYSTDDPGIWTAEKWQPGERELRNRGIEFWYPDSPPRHAELIRVLRISQDTLVINHCSGERNSGVFSLMLKRSPGYLTWWDWYDLQRELYGYDLPNIFRYTAVCGACSNSYSVMFLVLCFVISKLL